MNPKDMQAKIIEGFLETGEAFEQFDHLLQLAAQLDEIADDEKVSEALVSGCQSQVWIYLDWAPGATGESFRLRGDSDTLMVRGVLRIFQMMFEGQSARSILDCPIEFVGATDLASIFDEQRKGGVAAIAGRIRDFAAAALGEGAEDALDAGGAPTLKDRLDASASEADETLRRIVAGDLDYEEFRLLVHRFTLAKFFLTEEEYAAVQTDNILELANVSVEKLLRENDKSVKLAEGSTTCTNQSSTDIKKVLLSMTLQRALGVKFTPDQSADCETITQLADALYHASR